MGRRCIVENDDTFEVTGVVADVLTNSHFHFDFLASFTTLGIDETPGWRWRNQINYYTYLLLREGENPALLRDRIDSVYRKYAPEGKAKIVWELQPLASIHLHSNLENEIEPNRSAASVYILSATALFILLIAGINFVNLTTARSARRAKEVGLRKVLGADRNSLLKQFLGESILISLLALLLSVGLLQLFAPYFLNLVPLNIDDIWSLLPYALLGAVVVGVIAGIYPALFLAAFQPARSLAKPHKTGALGVVLRKGLVVFQFAISIILIVGTLIMNQQMQFVLDKRLGFQKEQVLVLNLSDQLRPNYESFKSDLLKQPGVLASSALYRMPGENASQNTFRPEGVSPDSYPSMKTLYVDHDFLETMDVKLAAGRSFSREFTTDVTEAFMLNEAAAKMLGWNEPTGKSFSWWNRDGKVIGLVKDFHFASLHQRIEPLVLFIFPDMFRRVAVRVSPDNMSDTIAAIEKSWKAFVPNRPFRYSFLDKNFAQLYKADRQFGNVCRVFSVLAVFIACLGLLGLAAFSTEQRTKEIGVRKVLGASVTRLMVLLSSEFTTLVGIAFLIASPIAYFALNRWLQNFAYRIEVTVWPFLLAAVLALLVAVITVSSQAIKAALANPVDSLRCE